MANPHSNKEQLNSSTGQRSKKKTSQGDLSALITRSSCNVEDDEEAVCSGSQDLIKRPGFESLPQIRILFDNQFNYIGHKKSSDKFVATCKRCIEIGTSRLYYFDLGNFKSNGNRHYRLSHGDIAVEVKPNHTVKEFFSSTHAGYSNTDPIQSRFNTNLLDLVSIDGLPYSFINGIGFRNLVSDLNPRVTFPDRVTLARRLNSIVDKTVKPNIKNPLVKVQEHNLHVTTDIWTTKQGDGIIGIKCHYIEKTENPRSWNMVSKVLAAEEFNDRHSGENIKNSFTKCLNSLGIGHDKIGYLVTDGASNMVCGFRDWINETEQNTKNAESFVEEIDVTNDTDREESSDQSDCSDEEEDDTSDPGVIDDADSDTEHNVNISLGEIFRFSCYAHRFQLVVKDVLAKGGRPKDVLDCANNIIKYFMRSSYWRKRLKKVLGKVLLKPAPTRWNYTFYILERLTQDNVYEEVCNLIHEASTGPRKPKNLPPTPSMEVKEKMVEIRNLLAPICEATNLLQGDGVTSSLIYYAVVNTYDEIAKTPTKMFTCMKSQLLDGMKARFEDDLTDAVVVLSALLDPRQKLDVFEFKPASYGTRSLNTPSTTMARNILETFCKPDRPTYSLISSSSDKSLEDFTFKKLPQISKRGDEEADEVQRYLNLPRQPNVDPLEFWAANELNFPGLAKLATTYLSIPASTGGIERVFSRLGSLGRARRSSLAPKSLQNIVLHREYRLPILNQRLKQKNTGKRVINPNCKPSKKLRSDGTDPAD